MYVFSVFDYNTSVRFAVDPPRQKVSGPQTDAEKKRKKWKSDDTVERLVNCGVCGCVRCKTNFAHSFLP